MHQTVDIGRGKLLLAVSRQQSLAQIIGVDEDYVGGLRLCRQVAETGKGDGGEDLATWNPGRLYLVVPGEHSSADCPDKR